VGLRCQLLRLSEGVHHEHSFDLSNHFAEGYGCVTVVKLVFQFDKALIGSNKTPRQNPRDVKYRDWVFPEERRISDIKL
jgi:hypothetical protein